MGMATSINCRVFANTGNTGDKIQGAKHAPNAALSLYPQTICLPRLNPVALYIQCERNFQGECSEYTNQSLETVSSEKNKGNPEGKNTNVNLHIQWRLSASNGIKSNRAKRMLSSGF
jgi:hypothetical protein